MHHDQIADWKSVRQTGKLKNLPSWTVLEVVMSAVCKLVITTNWVNADMLLAWLRRRKKADELVRRDATDLITRDGDTAYSVARMRSLGKKMIDVNRPQAHRSRVKMEIASSGRECCSRS